MPGAGRPGGGEPRARVPAARTGTAGRGARPAAFISIRKPAARLEGGFAPGRPPPDPRLSARSGLGSSEPQVCARLRWYRQSVVSNVAPTEAGFLSVCGVEGPRRALVTQMPASPASSLLQCARSRPAGMRGESSGPHHQASPGQIAAHHLPRGQPRVTRVAQPDQRLPGLPGAGAQPPTLAHGGLQERGARLRSNTTPLTARARPRSPGNNQRTLCPGELGTRLEGVRSCKDPWYHFRWNPLLQLCQLARLPGPPLPITTPCGGGLSLGICWDPPPSSRSPPAKCLSFGFISPSRWGQKNTVCNACAFGAKFSQKNRFLECDLGLLQRRPPPPAAGERTALLPQAGVAGVCTAGPWPGGGLPPHSEDLRILTERARPSSLIH
ncbi:uncharacterized protein LOC116661778 isoform X2 [Camelus ferus]|uniref:Uncharacterized protein LOC116661778 isoform X2 n=4 Tax=Camelus TaxID=9836 RepID=A0A8B8SJ04_CAMFR|nr:uncharacterized protein LOC116661778 isoform X2 [Camelus ferus]XP_032330213.1 uncharacterized protein LOC116661778 isoform X2 [Camelus ferus]